MKRTHLKVEGIESRLLPAPLPVLMVIADQQDFYYMEYNNTRISLEAKGVPVVVAATTTNPSKAHSGSGQGTGSGIVTPNIALAAANAADYSAIVFVGGWGASMYQYAFNDPDLNGTTDNYYFNTNYNGDANLNDDVIAPQKVKVNSLINELLAADKPVAGICHGTTVLAWARVNGVSPVNGKHITVPHTDGTPGMFFAGANYSGGYAQGQYFQALANGAIVSATGGQIGNPTTTADDVVVDGRIITAENQHSATYFGTVVANEVLASTPPAVANVSVNGGAVQRSRVTSLAVTFDTAVTSAQFGGPDAITLTRASDGAKLSSSGTFNFRVTATGFGTPTLTLTFPDADNTAVRRGALADGVWHLAIPAIGYTGPVITSLYGDLDGNATVDAGDYGLWGNNYGVSQANLAEDFDFNGTIDAVDFAALGNRFGITL